MNINRYLDTQSSITLFECLHLFNVAWSYGTAICSRIIRALNYACRLARGSSHPLSQLIMLLCEATTSTEYPNIPCDALFKLATCQHNFTKHPCAWLYIGRVVSSISYTTFNLGRYKSAFDLIHQNIEDPVIVPSFQQENMLLYWRFDLAYAYCKAGCYNVALHLFEQVRHSHTRKGIESTEKCRAAASGMIGFTYYRMGFLDKAADHLYDAFQWAVAGGFGHESFALKILDSLHRLYEETGSSHALEMLHSKHDDAFMLLENLHKMHLAAF